MTMNPFLEARVDMEKILVVDDEPLACEFLKKFLGKQGYEISMATTGEQALELIQAERLHLVLLDIRMPGMDGMEVMRRAKAIIPPWDSSWSPRFVTIISEGRPFPKAPTITSPSPLTLNT